MHTASQKHIGEWLGLQGVNVMLFNYRGIGLSAGSVTCEGVVVDADSVYQVQTQPLISHTVLLRATLWCGVSATVHLRIESIDYWHYSLTHC